MRLLTPYLLFTLVFALTSTFVHKDRIEKPKSYRFLFPEGETITLDNPNDSILTTYSNDIVSRKRKLVRAELQFKTGETLSFESEGDKWATIKISDVKKQFTIPTETIAKIPEIHFATVALLWDGLDERAFNAKLFLYSIWYWDREIFQRVPRAEFKIFWEQFFEANNLATNQ